MVRLDLHVQLEKELAAFVGKDEALCFSTGFTVNSGVIPALTDRNDYIICDDRDHASIVDGRRLSFSQQLKYKHNDMADLEKQLQKCNPDSVKLIIVDGVFSMEGDLANLPEIVRLKHKYNATIMVDEAHGLGVFGKQGRGVCDHFGLTHEVDLIMGTFSKSLASIGGFIAADSSIINWLRHNARTYIFSASNTPAATASALEALHIIQNEPERLEALWEATNYALKRSVKQVLKSVQQNHLSSSFMYETRKKHSWSLNWLSTRVYLSIRLFLRHVHRKTLWYVWH